MFYNIFAIFAFLMSIHANPFPQSSNELINARQYSTDTTSDVAFLSPSSDLEITGNEGDPPPEDRIITGNTLDEANTNPPSPGCTADGSTDVLDENTVLRRSTACPANYVAPPRPVLPGPLLPGPVLPGPVQNPIPSRKKTPVDVHKNSESKGDDRCADHPDKSHHLKCGGPEIGVNNVFVSMVANCERAGKHLTAPLVVLFSN